MNLKSDLHYCFYKVKCLNHRKYFYPGTNCLYKVHNIRARILMDSNPQSQNGRMGEDTHSSTVKTERKKISSMALQSSSNSHPTILLYCKTVLFYNANLNRSPLKSFQGLITSRNRYLWSWVSLMVKSVKNPPAMRETWVRSLVGRTPEEGMATHSNTHAWENAQGQRSLVGYSPWSCKQMDTTERLSTTQHNYEVLQAPVFLSSLISYPYLPPKGHPGTPNFFILYIFLNFSANIPHTVWYTSPLHLLFSQFLHTLWVSKTDLMLQ